MRWFGRSWGAPVCELEEQALPPVGSPCGGRCGEPIARSDSGLTLPLAGGGEVAYHLACFAELIAPSAPGGRTI